jgi:DNA-binding IclR family transcriptional regulator
LYPEERLEAYSEHTPKTVMALFDLIVDDRKQGYALGVGYYDAGTTPIAAPVRDHTGHVVAALGITLSGSAFEPGSMQSLALEVKAAADDLSRLLNYRPGQAVAAAPTDNIVSLTPRSRQHT